MGCLEAVTRDITGDEKLTLGEILKKRPELVPAPLDTALSKVDTPRMRPDMCRRGKTQIGKGQNLL
jgi:hypothetical protein